MELDGGEKQTIALAIDRRADVVIMDETPITVFGTNHQLPITRSHLKIPSPPGQGERVRVRGSAENVFLAMNTIAIASPHPSPLPTIAGRGSIFETASKHL